MPKQLLVSSIKQQEHGYVHQLQFSEDLFSLAKRKNSVPAHSGALGGPSDLSVADGADSKVPVLPELSKVVIGQNDANVWLPLLRAN